MRRLRITLRNLHAVGWVGVDERERSLPQSLVVSAHLWTTIDAAFGSDDLRTTIDYSVVAATLRRRAYEFRTVLVETLADELALECLRLDPRIRAVSISVEKPLAVPGADAGVEVFHRRTVT
jgi:dihydroneopterin aldolase